LGAHGQPDIGSLSEGGGGMRVLFVTQTTALGPASRLRVYQFLPALEESGVQYEVSPAVWDAEYAAHFGGSQLDKAWFLPQMFLRRRLDLKRMAEFDAVFIQKKFFQLDALRWRLTHPRIIYDFDDALFGGATERILRVSRTAFAGNEFLAEYARRFARRVLVMPTVVDTRRFTPAMHRSPAAPPVVGWIGSRTTLKYLEALRPVLESPVGFRVNVVSSQAPSFACAFERWSLEREVAQVQAMDIGLAPLADTEWERGKCGLKTLQYLACGIPVVGSPVGVQRKMIERSGGGVLARTLEEWREKIRWLADHPDKREAMGERGRAFVEVTYSLREWAPRWVEQVLAATRGE